MKKGILILRDTNGERSNEFRIEFNNSPKVTIKTVPKFFEGKYSGEIPIGHKWDNFQFKTLDVDRIPNTLKNYSFIDGTVEYFIEGNTEYKGNGNYETTIYRIEQKL